MHELIAIDMLPGAKFVTALRRAWDDGDAVLPIDQRLPDTGKQSLVLRLGATLVETEQGRTVCDGGEPVDPGDALVVATSGTTGQPRGVVLTHEAVAASARITSDALGVDPDRDTWLACLPVAHIGGLAVVTRSLHTATPLVVHERFDAAECEDAARNGATLVSLVVTALHRIEPGLFRTILLGGSTIPVLRPLNTVATYGMTETGSGVVYDGRPLEGVQIQVVNDEIHVKSPTLFRCYRDDPGGGPAGEWFRTGDAGSLSDNGTLSVQGRMGDLIVTGAEKVWPTQVEAAMARLEWVSEVAVIGRADAEWGDQVVAIVVPVADTETPPLDAVREQLSHELPNYALPRVLEIVAALPRTSSGKVRRDSL